jgi:hypothetical protein
MFTTSGSRVRGSGAERVGEPGRARPHVVPDDDGGRGHHLDEGGTRTTSELLVDLVRHGAPDVVRLEDRTHARGIEAAHLGDSSHPARMARWSVSRW